MAPRIMDFPPVYCSACWCADPEATYVDYQADNDQGYGNDPNNRIPYDNLQLCANCMKVGAQLVGMVDGAEREQDIRDKEVKLDRLGRELRQAQTFADNLESALGVDPHGRQLDHRRKPRQIKEPA